MSDDTSDSRVTCRGCAHHDVDEFRCGNHRAAGLWSDDISPAMAALPQHCPGYAPVPVK